MYVTSFNGHVNRQAPGYGRHARPDHKAPTSPALAP